MQIHKPAVVAISEPRISGDRALDTIRQLRFPNFVVEDANGFSGGIWVLWDEEIVQLKILRTSSQSIHAEVSWDGTQQCQVTFVYGTPRRLDRTALWDELVAISDHVNGPWLVLGDFNATLTSTDKQGGEEFSIPQSEDFTECLDRCALFDLGFAGPRFTWRRTNLLVRLDRAVVNEEWLFHFPESANFHLPRVKSNHRHIKVCTSHLDPGSKPIRPFRFNAAWLSHEDFPRLIKDEWKSGKGITVSLQEFKDQFVLWNKTTFGNIFRRKRRLERKLTRLELHNENWSTAASLAKEKETRVALETTLMQESVLWIQKVSCGVDAQW
ncbi:hypothetical protein LINGRAPRIM_LOCUS555 [Linum grandiflorum]